MRSELLAVAEDPLEVVHQGPILIAEHGALRLGGHRVPGYRAAELPELDHLLPARCYLISEPGRGPVRAVTGSSAKYPGRTPAALELFRISIRPEADATDATMLGLARAALSRTLGIDAVPVLEHIPRWTGVMPQYEVGHLDRVAEVERSSPRTPG